MPKRRIEAEAHEVLVNRKSGKISSSSSEINILRVKAYLSGDNTGIMQPLYSAGKRLCKSNNIQTKRMRKPKDGSNNDILRHQAQELLVPLALLYDLDRPQHLLPSRIKFAKWISQQLRMNGSEAYYLALQHNFHDLVDTPRGFQWWLQQLKNYRVKHTHASIR